MSILVQSAGYVGNYALSSVVRFNFNTGIADGTPTTLAGTPVLKVYKDNNTTESTSGVTLTVDFDSRTGMHNVAIDCSSDGTFYSLGSEFSVVVTTGTVGGTSVVGCEVGHFSLLHRVDQLANAAHGGSGSVLTLQQINVYNTSGDAVVFQCGGGSGVGLSVISNAGHALSISSSGSGNDGIHLSSGSRYGFYVEGSATDGGFEGLYCRGGTGGNGAPGATIISQGGDNDGLALVSHGTGASLACYPDTGGDSIRGKVVSTSNGGVTLADGVAHGGTPGSSTATLSLAKAEFYSTGAPALYLHSIDSAAITAVGGLDTYAVGMFGGDAGVVGTGGAGLKIGAGENRPAVQILGPWGTSVQPIVSLEDGGSGDCDGLSIAAAGSGKKDVALAGSGSIYDSVNSRDVSSNVSGIAGNMTAATVVKLLNSGLETGTAQAGGASTITLRAGAPTGNTLANQAIYIASGAGAGQTNKIMSGVGVVMTVETAWVVQPDSTSVYVVLGRVG